MKASLGKFQFMVLKVDNIAPLNMNVTSKIF